jgi:thymidylate synthase
VHLPRALSRLKLNPDVKSIFDFNYDDIVIERCTSRDAIKADAAV